MAEEMGSYRGEVIAMWRHLPTYGSMSDVSWSCSKTMKRKRSKKEISEQARLRAEKDPVVRRLRELVSRGRAELEARRRGDAPPQT